jgi:YfiH family protein
MSSFCSFSRGPDGVYRCDAFAQFIWQVHGFGTRLANQEPPITLRQIHSDRVVNAAGLQDREKEGDALITNQIDTVIGVRTADCVPILLLDSETRAVAAVHAGWRGTVKEIVKQTVEQMWLNFGTRTRAIHAAIGPCIRACCYKVGADVFNQFRTFFPEWDSANVQRTLNLAETNRRQLEAAGVREDHVFDCGLCTMCESAEFFSFRREPANPGRMTAAIARLV